MNPTDRNRNFAPNSQSMVSGGMMPSGVNNQTLGGGLPNNRGNFQNPSMISRQHSGSQNSLSQLNNANGVGGVGLVGNFPSNNANLQSRISGVGGPHHQQQQQQQQQQQSILGMSGPSMGIGQSNAIRPNQGMYNNNNFSQRNNLNSNNTSLNQNSIMGNRPPFNSVSNGGMMPMRPTLSSNMPGQQNNLSMASFIFF